MKKKAERATPPCKVEAPAAPAYGPRLFQTYLGGKWKVAPLIRKHMEQRWGKETLSQLELVDAFAGSGAFTLHCGDAFRSVVLNDKERYAYAACLAAFTRPPPSHWPKPPARLASGGHVTREYCENGRRFFKRSNGVVIDFYRDTFQRLRLSGKLSALEYDYALGCLTLASDKVANIETSYYSYVQPGGTYKVVPTNIRSEGLLRPKAIVDVRVCPVQAGDFPGADKIAGRVRVLNRDATLLALEDTVADSVLYLDPPYNYRPYFENNHLLVVIADPTFNPPTHGTVGLPPKELRPPPSVWEERETALLELDRILALTPARRVALSYMSPHGAMTLADLKAAFDDGWTYSVYQNLPSSVKGELLILAERKHSEKTAGRKRRRQV
jgi:adenine-specific DNA methylase